MREQAGSGSRSANGRPGGPGPRAGGRDSQEQRSRSRKPGTEPGMADPGQSATDLARRRRRLAGGPPGGGRGGDWETLWRSLAPAVEAAGGTGVGGGGRVRRRGRDEEGDARLYLLRLLVALTGRWAPLN